MQSKAKVRGYCYCIYAFINFNREIKQENMFLHETYVILNVLFLDNIALQRTGSMPR